MPFHRNYVQYSILLMHTFEPSIFQIIWTVSVNWSLLVLFAYKANDQQAYFLIVYFISKGFEWWQSVISWLVWNSPYYLYYENGLVCYLKVDLSP